MKAVIFAGGAGTRLWPLSRKKSPKQFEKMIDNKSTIRLTIERLMPEFKPEDIYISTGKKYWDLIKKQLPEIPDKNIIGEPMKKDVGPAVALLMGILKNIDENEPVLILWSDHLVKNVEMFKKLILTAGEIVKKEGEKIVFIGQKPRFASENLGWIEFGTEIKKENGVSLYEFMDFKYRPDQETANIYFTDQKHCWNLGYFVTTPNFIYKQFERFAPEIFEPIEKIVKSYNTPDYEKVLNEEYVKTSPINFDNAVLEKIDKHAAYVLNEDIGWTDVGAWEALKEALEKNIEENVTHGKTLIKDSRDSLIYNYDNDKLIVGIDLDEMLVVNTKDVLMVAKKTSVSKIKKLVESFEGTEYEELT